MKTAIWVLACVPALCAQSPYAGSEACAACHPEHYRGFRRTAMARSLAPISLRTAPEFQTPVQFSHPRTGSHFRVFHKGPDFVIEEFLPPSAGDLSYSDLRKVSFTIGSGNHARSYLVERAGRLYEAPVSYYTQIGSWDMSPGYDTEARTGFTRKITADCLFCHAGRVKPGGRTNPFLEVSIGCERCHGPGRQHLSGEGASIINPAKLSPRLREQVCDQCHLSGAARVTKSKRRLGDFRAGEPLENYLAIFTYENVGSGTLSVTGHSEQMKRSGCWQAAGDRLWCGSCHDAHRQPSPAERIGWYRARCMNCHQKGGCTRKPDGTAPDRDDNCIACHMPKRPVVESAHVIFTDHRIPRRPAPPPASAGARLKPILRAANDPPHAAARDLGFAYLQAAGSGGHPEFLDLGIRELEPLAETEAVDAEFWEKLGEAYLGTRQFAKAERTFRKAAGLNPKSAAAQYGLGFLSQARGALPDAIEAYRKAVALDPEMAEAYGNAAAAYASAGRNDDAADALQKALQLDPGNLRWRQALRTLR